MVIKLLTTDIELKLYDEWIKSHPHGTLWQSLERKKYVESLGKGIRIYAAIDDGKIAGSAMVVIDETAFNIRTWEIPRGPIGESTQLMKVIRADAKKNKTLSICFSPLEKIPIKSSPSMRHVHCEATRIIDLTQSEEEIMNQMKPKGRYNIRVALKHNVSVKQSEDIDAFYKLVNETSGRDGFTALPKSKYEAFLKHLNGSFLFLAFDAEKNEPIAGLLGVIWTDRGIYYYGASSYAHRALMAPYALQWEAMRLCKAKGCKTYDLLGVAPQNADDDHPWQNISRFKEKFGGRVITYPSEQQIILRPIMKWLLKIKRKIKK